MNELRKQSFVMNRCSEMNLISEFFIIVIVSRESQQYRFMDDVILMMP